MDATSPLFFTFALADGVTLRNRVVMAPMTTWASNDDLRVSDDEIAYYRRRGGGVGLVITGCTHAHAKRPFFLGYRVSPEEGAKGGLRMTDTYALIDAIVLGGVDYIHASLASVLDARPIDMIGDQTIAELVVAHVAGRAPVIAAGQIRTPEQAETALGRGLPLVAVGQGLVMNPKWVELAQARRAGEIATVLDVSTVAEVAIPQRLWTVIEATTGWFAVA